MKGDLRVETQQRVIACGVWSGKLMYRLYRLDAASARRCARLTRLTAWCFPALKGAKLLFCLGVFCGRRDWLAAGGTEVPQLRTPG